MIALIALAMMRAQLPDTVWMEGEAPTSINVKAQIAGWGHKEFLSGEKWLQVSIDAEKVDKELPTDGALLSYSFATQTGGSHEIWNRIGYEAVRSTFKWRVDDEPWKVVTNDQLTTDMQEFETWNEVAWLKMGDENLTPGNHNLQILLPNNHDAKGKTERVLYASDALLVTGGHFRPNGKFAPGTESRTDIDRKAESAKATVEDHSGPVRQTVELGGLWQIARDDEELPGPVEKPIDRVPTDPIWYGIVVPSDKNTARPELTMAHRVWYRKRIEVPKGQVGRSFRLTFPQNNLNTTIYVNGVFCGFNKNPFVEWSCDITKAVKPGENEVWVGIRDAWYGYSSNPKDPMKLRKSFVIPLSMTGSGFQDMAYPVWHGFMSGILDTPRLMITGPMPVTDVFVKPSVASKALAAEVTVLNTTGSPAKGTVEVQALDDKTGEIAKDLGSTPFEMAAGEEKVVNAGGAWADPTLWWPDQPHMYRLRTTVRVDGKPTDVSETPFGFREWTHHGKDLFLNGIVWHGWAELTQGKTKEEWLQNFRKTGQRFMRLSGTSQNGGPSWMSMSFEKALDWFDRNGVIVRRCGPLDGEAIGYFAIENDPDLQALYHTRIKKQLLDNWRDQMVAQVRGERNHPAIGMWSVENEWLYINCINLYGDLMDEFEQEEKKTLDAVAVIDPTRPAMSDGGGSGKGDIFPIHGDHYVYTNNPNQYPETAYQPFPEGGGRGRWVWDGNRPRYMGEEFFATGINPADYAWIEGEEAFGGKKESEKGMALVQRMLTEGYRWGGYYTAWHLWIGDEGAAYGKYVPNAERAVFCRQHDWTFASGQKVSRTFGIFNDSHSSEPLIFTYTFKLNGKTVGTETKSFTVAPGANVKFDRLLVMPSVSVRGEGELSLSLKTKDGEVFHDRKPLSILPQVHASTSSWLGVFAGGTASAELMREGFGPIAVTSLDSVPKSVIVLVVGKNALSQSESTESKLAALAAEGRRIIVLDQNNPLHFQALPVEIETSKDNGDFAFPEVAEHPAFKGLAPADFKGWSGGVYRNAYTKPLRGARSLLQVGSRLGETALVEVPVGPGLMLLSQVRMDASPVASVLLKNLVGYARDYKLTYRPVSVAANDDPRLVSALARIGLKSETKATVMDAIAGGAPHIAILSASPANLHSLAENLPLLKSFLANGGSIVFHGLTPAGLADYNRIVGVEHLIRPFRREKVGIRVPRDPLASGLSSSDVVMYSGEKMFDFNDDRYVASDIFSYVVDYDDVAPFATLADDYLYNTVNGFVSADGWKYIYSFDMDHNKPEYTMKFPRSQEFSEIEWTGNAFYHKVTRFSLTFDGKETVNFDVQPNNSPQTLAISPPRSGQKVELRILDWTHDQQTNNVVGIDNITLKAKRTPDFYSTVHPLLNVGGLVRYSRGPGSIVLANLLLKDREEVPENADKKLAILASLLRNLKAPFSGGKTVVVGASNLEYRSVDLAKSANQYRNDRGWFGDKNRTLADLPSGHHVFGGVPFEVFDFPTSPVPNAVMLGGSGVPGNLAESVNGIPVAGKASALFFLQTARMDQPLSDQERREGKKFEMADYVVHYGDGKTATIPVYAELDINDYREDHPMALPGAQLGWVHPYAGSSTSAVAYIMQWNNPRPDVEIVSIDLRYGPAKRGVPALLAVTAAK